MRISEEEYRALIGTPPTKSKYNNRKAEYYDPQLKKTLTFDSEKERDYYLILKDREKRGEISHIERQIPIEIQPAFTDKQGNKIRAIKYIADFSYLDNEDKFIHFIDVKGMRTEVYKLKKKLLAYKGVYIEEV